MKKKHPESARTPAASASELTTTTTTTRSMKKNVQTRNQTYLLLLHFCCIHLLFKLFLCYTSEYALFIFWALLLAAFSAARARAFLETMLNISNVCVCILCVDVFVYKNQEEITNSITHSVADGDARIKIMDLSIPEIKRKFACVLRFLFLFSLFIHHQMIFSLFRIQ